VGGRHAVKPKGDSRDGERYSTVSTLEFNEDGFKRAAQAAAQAKAKEMQRQMDQFARQYKGRPVAVIKSALRRVGSGTAARSPTRS
jgi:hypothetical protein